MNCLDNDYAGNAREKGGTMEQEQTAREEYVQVGVTALRAPDGSFLPAVPLYIKATPEAKAAEAALKRDITGILAQRMKPYMEQAARGKRKESK